MIVGIVVQPHFMQPAAVSAKTENSARIGLRRQLPQAIRTIGWALTVLIAWLIFAGIRESESDPDTLGRCFARAAWSVGLPALSA